MDAVEFLKKYFELCKSNECCENCPINKCLDDSDYSVCVGFMFNNPEKIVDAVSKI